MTLFDALLAALMRLTPADPSEPPDAFVERQEVIAHSVVDETSRPRRGWPKFLLPATVFETMRRESAFDRRIHAGLAHPRFSSDRGRARCLAQLHASRLVPDWEETAGTDQASTDRCARGAARILVAKQRQCVPGGIRSERDLAEVLTAYAVGRCGEPTVDAQVRAAKAFAFARELRAATRCASAQPDERFAEVAP